MLWVAANQAAQTLRLVASVLAVQVRSLMSAGAIHKSDRTPDAPQVGPSLGLTWGLFRGADDVLCCPSTTPTSAKAALVGRPGEGTQRSNNLPT